MKKIIVKGAFVFGALLAVPTFTHQTPEVVRTDARYHLLDRFFAAKKAPARAHVADFIEAADRHSLDWRLLPSIAHVESSGGKNYKNNNIFGWGSAELRFPSVKAGIYKVAERLANSKLYKDKGLWDILRTYNSNAEYPPRVMRVMSLIGPAAVPVL